MANVSNSRRAFLKSSAAYGAALALSGCGGGGGTETTFSAPITTAATVVAKEPQVDQAVALMQPFFEQESLGALVVGVWKNGLPLLVTALGASLTGVPATVDMHHRLGNVSASMLATAFLQQVDAGRLALTDKLSRWFPQLPSADAITLEMLARSTTGYRQYTALDTFQTAFYADPFKHFDIGDVIAYGVAGGPLYPPGTSWNFSDTNFLILSQVLEAATGTPVDRLIAEGVLAPLGMSNTRPPLNADLPAPVLHSYTGERNVWEEATFWDPSWTSYAGGYGSNQEDLRRLYEALGTGSLLSQASHEAQLAPATVGLGVNTANRYYAMGVAVVNGWLFLNPNLQGYRGAVGYLPSEKLAMVMYSTLTQSADPDKNQSGLLFESFSEIFAPGSPIGTI